MDKRYLLTMAAAAAMFAACSDDAKELSAPELATNPTEVAQQQNIPVAFGAYVNRATTRAGAVGALTTSDDSDGNVSLQTEGFGVFGYYTDNNDYDQLAVPNFMYNQKVTYDSYWKYEPVRYWPNEYGSTAIADDNDKVSFFAYAPYVDVDDAGKVAAGTNKANEWGIVQLSRNTASGDPIVKYIASFNAKQAVDLCWGVNQTSDRWQVVTGGQQDLNLGLPWLNVQRPANAGTQASPAAAEAVKFQFMHALAKMKVNVDAYVDGMEELDAATRIWIRSVRFTGFAMKGALNLNNETANKPYWLNFNGVGDLESDGEVIVYDGRRDGKEGMVNAVASNEKSMGLNPQFIQIEDLVASDAWSTTKKVKNANDEEVAVVGVNKTTATLFDGGGVFYVIPTGDEMEVEIVYDVETIDGHMGFTLSDGNTKGSTIENRISKTITFGSVKNIEAGKAYEINLHLGMNSVKFDADVKAWDDLKPATDVDMPANMPQLAWVGGDADPAAAASMSIPGYKDGAANADMDFNFAITGLTGGEAMTVATGTDAASFFTFVWGSKLNATDKIASQNGVLYVKATLDKEKINQNTVSVELAKAIKVTNSKSKVMNIKITLLPVKLGLVEKDYTISSNIITLERKDANTTTLSWNNAANDPAVAADVATAFAKDVTLTGYMAGTTPNNYIRVWVNGSELSKVDTPSINNEFSFSEADGKITFNTGAVNTGDDVKVTIKTGDVAEETINFTVGS